MPKQTFTAEDGSIIHYDSDTKEVRREELKVVSPLLWNPKDGDVWYHLSCFCSEIFRDAWDNRSDYIYNWIIGNCYRTHKEARQAQAKQLAQVRVLRRIAELNDGWVPDWKDATVVKFSVYFNHATLNFSCGRDICCQSYSPDMYLKSQAAADSLIASHSDDLKLIFGISKS